MKTKDHQNYVSHSKLTRVGDKGCGRTAGCLKTSGTKSEKVLNVGREQLPPWAVRVTKKDGVNDEGQQPLTAVHPHLETDTGNILIRSSGLEKKSSRPVRNHSWGTLDHSPHTGVVTAAEIHSRLLHCRAGLCTELSARPCVCRPEESKTPDSSASPWRLNTPQQTQQPPIQQQQSVRSEWTQQWRTIYCIQHLYTTFFLAVLKGLR